MAYRVFTTERFDKKLSKFDFQLRNKISSVLSQIKANPFVGKPLGYKFLREKKVNKHRVYYMVYSDFFVVLVLNISSKKNQQEVINEIKSLIHVYYLKIKERFIF